MTKHTSTSACNCLKLPVSAHVKRASREGQLSAESSGGESDPLQAKTLVTGMLVFKSPADDFVTVGKKWENKMLHKG